MLSHIAHPTGVPEVAPRTHTADDQPTSVAPVIPRSHTTDHPPALPAFLNKHLSSAHLSASPNHPYSSWPSIPPHPLGRLAILTPAIVRQASESILTGQRFNLDWPVYPSIIPLYGRAKTEHHTKRVDKGPENRPQAGAEQNGQGNQAGENGQAEAGEGGQVYQPVFDDFVHLNTQGTTQWDYFMHYSYPHSGYFYGGLTAEQVAKEDTGDIGVAAIAKAGGVQTRALLIDLPYYLESKGLPAFEPFTGTVSFATLLDAMKFLNLEPRIGDVLFLRLGFEEALYEDIARVERGEETRLHGNWGGAEVSPELIQWIWETGFVAIGSDNPTFEMWPASSVDNSLHPVVLSGMGIMIGELFKLRELAEACKKHQRWSFWFSSCPLMIEHGVASPPNAVAIM